MSSAGVLGTQFAGPRTWSDYVLHTRILNADCPLDVSRRPNPAIDPPPLPAASVDRVNQLQRCQHSAGGVAVVAATGSNAVEPIVHEQEAFVAAVAWFGIGGRCIDILHRVPLW